MKALTIQQPDASLIADGEKWVENRTWACPLWLSGPLAIHAGRGSRYLAAKELAKYPTGAVVAVARRVECVRLWRVAEDRRSTALEELGIDVEEFLAHKHTEGPWCWVLRDVVKLACPIPAKGRQGLWEWKQPASVLYERGSE